jgi:hypothetical protein
MAKVRQIVTGSPKTAMHQKHNRMRAGTGGRSQFRELNFA